MRELMVAENQPVDLQIQSGAVKLKIYLIKLNRWRPLKLFKRQQ